MHQRKASMDEQQRLTQRLMNHKDKIQSKIQILQEEKSEQTMKECSFAPNLNMTMQTSPTLKQKDYGAFYDSQVSYQQNAMLKCIQKYHEQMQSMRSQTSVELVCPGSQKISKKLYKSQSPSVYDRLYSARMKDTEGNFYQKVRKETS